MFESRMQEYSDLYGEIDALVDLFNTMAASPCAPSLRELAACMFTQEERADQQNLRDLCLARNAESLHRQFTTLACIIRETGVALQMNGIPRERACRLHDERREYAALGQTYIPVLSLLSGVPPLFLASQLNRALQDRPSTAQTGEQHFISMDKCIRAHFDYARESLHAARLRMACTTIQCMASLGTPASKDAMQDHMMTLEMSRIAIKSARQFGERGAARMADAMQILAFSTPRGTLN